MGGAQPLAITMNEGVALIAEVEDGELINALKQNTWISELTILMKRSIVRLKQKRKESHYQLAYCVTRSTCSKN